MASSTTILQTDTMSDTMTDWDQTLAFSQSDPSPGTLLDARIGITGDVDSSAWIQNLGSAATSTTLSVPISLAVGGINATGTAFVVDSANLCQFVGVGNVELTAKTTSSSSETGDGNLVSVLHTKPGAVAPEASGASVACFAAGTWIETTSGPVAVECLEVGMQVVTAPLHTASRGIAPIIWIGHRGVDCRRHPRPASVWPVCVRRGAFAARVPCHDLLLSPDHAIFCNGVLIPVKLLVNGTTVRQEPVEQITYYHVELPRHALLLAEDLPVESFLDTGNRSAFAEGGSTLQLYPDFSAWTREALGCAPIVVTGPLLDAAKARLAARQPKRRNGAGRAPRENTPAGRARPTTETTRITPDLVQDAAQPSGVKDRPARTV